MARTSLSFSKKTALLQLALLFGIAASISIAEMRLFRQRGLTPLVALQIERAEQLWRTGTMPQTAGYPPMVMFLALGWRVVTRSNINPYVFNFAMLAVGLAFMYGMTQYLLRRQWLAFWSTLIALLNPYFVWTLLLSQDAAAEFMFLSILLWLAAVALQMPEGFPRWKQLVLGGGIVASATALLLSRVTGCFVVVVLVVLATLGAGASWKRRFFVCCGAAFCLFTSAFCFYNYRLVGAFTLATNGGVNLYIGNHPAYLHGHPHYDIDVFMGKTIDPGTALLTEAERDRALRRKAIEFIQDDPLAFIYRAIRKSFWHWLNIEKIPNYTAHAAIVGETDVAWIAHLDRRFSLTTSLAYLLYKIVYIPLLLLGLVGIASAYLPGFLLRTVGLLRGRIDVRFLLLYAPLIGLWPVAVLTFPDTRFKINAEILVIPALIATWIDWRKPNQTDPRPHGP